jgi:hypothetical protein
MTDFNVGDIVKHIDQDIIGKIIKIHYEKNYITDIVIEDFHSEYESPDDQLIYKPSDLRIYNEKNN